MDLIDLPVPEDFGCWNEYERVNQILQLLDQQFSKVGEGTTRRVYDFSDDWVLKCPLSPSAIDCNITEQNLFDEEKNYNDNYCSCHTVVFYNIPLLFMEKVIPCDDDFTWEEDWRQDLSKEHPAYGCQVGLTKHGKVKAFDFCQF